MRVPWQHASLQACTYAAEICICLRLPSRSVLCCTVGGGAVLGIGQGDNDGNKRRNQEEEGQVARHTCRQAGTGRDSTWQLGGQL